MNDKRSDLKRNKLRERAKIFAYDIQQMQLPPSNGFLRPQHKSALDVTNWIKVLVTLIKCCIDNWLLTTGCGPKDHRASGTEGGGNHRFSILRLCGWDFSAGAVWMVCNRKKGEKRQEGLIKGVQLLWKIISSQKLKIELLFFRVVNLDNVAPFWSDFWKL